MPFTPIDSGAGVASSASSALVDLSAYSALISNSPVLRISNTGSETIAFKCVGAGGSTTLGGVNIMLLAPKELDEIPFVATLPYLAHITTSSGTFNWVLGFRLENTK